LDGSWDTFTSLNAGWKCRLGDEQCEEKISSATFLWSYDTCYHGNSECNAMLLIDQSVLFCGCDQSIACVALCLIFSSFSIKDEPSLLKCQRLIYFFSWPSSSVSAVDSVKWSEP
jgi:hypothetical protein